MRPNFVDGAICTSALVLMRGAPWAEELARAPGGKKLGKQWSACCPAHDDKLPSLIIFEGRTGAVQVRCMADCEPIEIIAETRWHEVADRLSRRRRRQASSHWMARRRDGSRPKSRPSPEKGCPPSWRALPNGFRRHSRPKGICRTGR